MLKLQSETIKSRTFWLTVIYAIGGVLHSFGVIPGGAWEIAGPVLIGAGAVTLRDAVAKK